MIMFVTILIFVNYGFKIFTILNLKQKINMLFVAIHFNLENDFEVLIHNVIDYLGHNFK